MTAVKHRARDAGPRPGTGPGPDRNQERHHLFFGLFQVLLLLGLAALQAVLLLSGAIHLYMAPKMQTFVIFSTAAFVLMALHGLWTLLAPGAGAAARCGCSHDHDPSPAGKVAMVVLFGLVLTAGFFLPHQVLDSRVAEKKGISLSRSAAPSVFGSSRETRLPPEDHLFFQEEIPWDTAQAWDVPSSGTDLGEEQAKLREELGIWYDRDLYQELSEELLDRDVLRITDDDFLDSMLIISAYLDRFQGRRVEFAGFVYHDGTMAENELAVARIAITCCLADAMVYGLLVQTDEPLPSNDTWVRVHGRIAATRFMEEDIPLILAERLETIPSPDQPYVYPRLYSSYVFEDGS
ncbi:TIGR03943 family putative permease subunit [Desulfonatronum thioautotrophicum]|uniref:TIGR03943 family putative permease subunit n=1 Tax=Desulfonatronum thioautotrophicum TaxID=617001 RepID=UPI0005EB65C3|nr:TIGR03943 family protein [Desulfonatronum thioautotrophicum]